ncbi:hypothetical protein V8E52_010024 [Russula decolorans]
MKITFLSLSAAVTVFDSTTTAIYYLISNFGATHASLLHHWHGPEGCDWRCSPSPERPLIGPVSKARTKRIPQPKEIVRREGPLAQPNTPGSTKHRRSSCGVHCLTQRKKRLGENGEGVSETGTCAIGYGVNTTTGFASSRSIVDWGLER